MKIPSRVLPIAVMILVPAVFRVLPYVLGALGLTNVHEITAFLWNVSPVSAVFLFGGAQFADRRCSFLAPLAAMLASDLGIGLLMHDMSFGFHATIPVIYGSYALIVWLGTLLRKQRSVWAIAGAGLAAEIAFFVITNFGTWLIQTGYYPHTLAGLAECYVAGLPFFRNSLAGMAVYGTLLFGGLAVVEQRFSAANPARLAPADGKQPTAA